MDALTGMIDAPDGPPQNPLIRPALDDLTSEEFSKRWTGLVGEPPSAMLDDRSRMLAILVESVPVEGLMLRDLLL